MTNQKAYHARCYPFNLEGKFLTVMDFQGTHFSQATDKKDIRSFYFTNPFFICLRTSVHMALTLQKLFQN